jgi:hypothetical protein
MGAASDRLIAARQCCADEGVASRIVAAARPKFSSSDGGTTLV